MPAGRDGAARGPSRRAVLLAGVASGVGAAAAITTGVLSESSSTPASALRRSASSSFPAVLSGPGATVADRVYSHARGRHVDLVLVLPTRKPPPGLPMSVLLHGRNGSARNAAPPGLAHRLGRDISNGRVPPFGFVAVDGGNSYWHEHHPGDDPLAMLLDEIPGWLRERGLGDAKGKPFAVTGTSMGGFGAFVYARRRNERHDPVDAITAISPALITSWRQMRKRKAFAGEAEWASLDPLRHIGATRGTPTAVWCGEQDPFIKGVRQFIRRARPELAHTAPGGHNGKFFRSTVPSLVHFLGLHAPRLRMD
ncbi:alpha/beta hydrolase [Prauserella sp. PE36]|uniref:alpha/beta hydrolase n=1 Tax=Prauserella sp. PE36 TaxID=1504709 RepID=UPI000DE3B2AC|nr:alpha/beta hydrolase-fold protein [Prauserella sp. PE36]RBM22510.1 alpha/beta hydrolase [Prauserella sp. PE36]